MFSVKSRTDNDETAITTIYLWGKTRIFKSLTNEIQSRLTYDGVNLFSRIVTGVQ